MSKTIYSISKNHYIYLLVDQNHKKYGGVRSCKGLPENDDYMGSSSYVEEAMENGNVFTKHIIKTFDTRDEANEYEEKWLKRMNAGYNSDWYNKTNGGKNFGNYGKKLGPRSEATKEKIRQARKKQVIVHSDETKRKIGDAHRGSKRTEETKKKMSDAAKGRIPWNKGKKGVQVAWNKGKKGRKLTEETKKKQSEAHKGQVPWNKGKKHTEETKKKISEATKGRIPWNKGICGYRLKKQNA